MQSLIAIATAILPTLLVTLPFNPKDTVWAHTACHTAGNSSCSKKIWDGNGERWIAERRTETVLEVGLSSHWTVWWCYSRKWGWVSRLDMECLQDGLQLPFFNSPICSPAQLETPMLELSPDSGIPGREVLPSFCGTKKILLKAVASALAAESSQVAQW